MSLNASELDNHVPRASEGLRWCRDDLNCSSISASRRATHEAVRDPASGSWEVWSFLLLLELLFARDRPLSFFPHRLLPMFGCGDHSFSRTSIERTCHTCSLSPFTHPLLFLLGSSSHPSSYHFCIRAHTFPTHTQDTQRLTHSPFFSFELSQTLSTSQRNNEARKCF